MGIFFVTHPQYYQFAHILMAIQFIHGFYTCVLIFFVTFSIIYEIYLNKLT